MVLATQSPIEEEGTYILPQAQLDRFLLKDVIDYPSADEELEVLDRIDSGVLGRRTPRRQPVVDLDDVDLLIDDGGGSTSTIDPALRVAIAQATAPRRAT